MKEIERGREKKERKEREKRQKRKVKKKIVTKNNKNAKERA